MNVKVHNIPTDPVNVTLRDASGNSVSAATSANLATGHVTSSTAAGTLIAARATRTSILFRNLDATISVYIGPHSPTLTSSNGMLLKAGESVAFYNAGLMDVIAASGSPIVAYAEEYN